MPLQVFKQKYIPEFVYGGIDGAVTTFAVVSGATGANADIRWVLIFGFANLIADGFSMSVGNYFSKKAERDNYEKHKLNEYWEIENLREAEIQEIRNIYYLKGFRGPVLERIVDVITADKDIWVDTMMKEELEMVKDRERSPFNTSIATFLSFNFIGLIPLTSYIFSLLFDIAYGWLFPLSCIATGAALGVVGYFKGKVTQTNRIRSVVETLIVGGLAAALAYFAGEILGSILLN